MAFGTYRKFRMVIYLTLSIFLGSLGNILAQSSNFSVLTTGNWNQSGTWTEDSGTDVDNIPDADDNVTIDLAFTVSLTGAEACNNLTISTNSSAILSLAGNTLTAGGNVSLDVGDLNGLGTLDINGNLTVGSTAGFTGFPSLTFSGGAAQSISGAYTGFINLQNFTVDGSSTVLTNSSSTFNSIVTEGVMTISNGAVFNPGSRNYSLNQNTIDGVALIVSETSSLNAGTDNSTFLITQNRDLNITNTTSGTVTFNNFTHQPTSGSASLTFSSGTYNINGTLTIADASSGFSGGTFVYSSGNLVYSTNETITIGNEWPTSSSPTDVTVNSSADFSITTGRTVAGTFTKTGSGDFEVNNVTLDIGTIFSKGAGTFTVSGVSGAVTYTTADLEYTSGQIAGDEWPSNNGPANVSISSGTVTQTSGPTISGDLTLSSSTSLSIGGSTMDVNGNVTLNNGSSVATTAGGVLQVAGNVATSSTATIGSTTTGTLEMNGSSAQSTSGILVLFNLTINNNGVGDISTSSNLRFNQGGTLLVTDGTFVLNANAAIRDASGNIPDAADNLQLEIASNGILETSGVDITKFNSHTFNNAGATVRFTGSNSETIPAEVYSNLTIENSNSTGPNTAGAVTINGTLTLTDGFVNNSSIITLGSGASVSGGSDASYIDGAIATTGTGDKLFPVGKSGSYRPIELLSVAGTTPVIRFELKEGAGGLPGSGINNLSIFRYWEGAEISGFTSGTVRLTYGSDDGVDGPTADLRVAESPSAFGTYNSIGNSTADGTTVTSTADIVTTIQYYRIGSELGDNSLPVELATFEATPAIDKITLNWTTASETENFGFNVFKKAGSEEWTKVNEQIIEGQGNKSSETKYEFVDFAVRSGDVYSYRLESVSLSGVINVEDIVEIEVLVPEKFVLFNNYPNPFNPVTHLKFQLPEFSKVSLKVYDITGRVVKTILNNATYDVGQHVVKWDGTNQNETKVSSGMYVYRFSAGKFSKLGRMILVK